MNHDTDFQRHKARLSGLEVSDGFLSGLDLRGAVAQSSSWLGCTFEDVRFDHGAFGDALFDRCRFVRCSFDGATLVSRIYRSTFDRCTFDYATFTGSHLLRSVLKGRAQHSNWERATLEETRLDLDLRAAQLNFAVTRGVDFRGSDLWSALLPMNCAMFTGNVFDERQIGCFVSLFVGSASPDVLVAPLLELPWLPKWQRLVNRIANPRRRAKMVA